MTKKGRDMLAGIRTLTSPDLRFQGCFPNLQSSFQFWRPVLRISRSCYDETSKQMRIVLGRNGCYKMLGTIDADEERP